MIIKCTQCKQDTVVNDNMTPWVKELVCTKCIIKGDKYSHSRHDDNNTSTFDNNEASY